MTVAPRTTANTLMRRRQCTLSVYLCAYRRDRHHLQPSMSLRDRSRRGAPVFRLYIVCVVVHDPNRECEYEFRFVFFIFSTLSPPDNHYTTSYDIGQQYFRLISVLRPLPPISPDTGSPARTGNIYSTNLRVKIHIR